MEATCSAELGSVRVSDQCSQRVSEPARRLVTDECAQRNTDVDFKRVADQCSQHDAYIAVSKLLAVRVSDSSADWVAVLRSFPAKDRSRPLLVAIGIGLWRYEPGTPDGKT